MKRHHFVHTSFACKWLRLRKSRMNNPNVLENGDLSYRNKYGSYNLHDSRFHLFRTSETEITWKKKREKNPKNWKGIDSVHLILFLSKSKLRINYEFSWNTLGIFSVLWKIIPTHWHRHRDWHTPFRSHHSPLRFLMMKSIEIENFR